MADKDTGRNLRLWLARQLLRHQIVVALFTILMLFAAQQTICGWLFPGSSGPQLTGQVVYASNIPGQ
jgi:hypothetical protein